MWFLDSHDNIYQPAVDLSQRFGWNHFKPQLLLYYWQMPLYIIKGVQHPQQTTHQRLSLRLHHINRGSKRHIDCRFVCTQTLFVNKAWCASSCHMSHLLTIWPSSCCTRRAPRPPPHHRRECVKQTSDLPYWVSFWVAPPSESVGHRHVGVKVPRHVCRGNTQ